ncbi:MAG: hypothetical protein AAGH40_10600 [Verrucomicrobiota bacterium]
MIFSDGDGTLDLWEFRAGTDPVDPTDRFSISGLTRISESNMDITFPSAQGRTYNIYSSSSLGQVFTLYQSGIIGTPPENTITVPTDSDSGFYSVGLNWPE